jgi:hypothetical protein
MIAGAWDKWKGIFDGGVVGALGISYLGKLPGRALELVQHERG